MNSKEENKKYKIRETNNKYNFQWIDYYAFFMLDKVTIEIGDKVINSKLPSTKGFFFGSESDERYYEDAVQFLEKAKKAISEGYIVYYTSWW